ncbi:hypothetical protein, partial [Actibacterium sp.]|uniref:hypothetical protein n=1 Tax=Actibacterium sp. TaxID=1872125 RepID=UPI003562601E
MAMVAGVIGASYTERGSVVGGANPKEKPENAAMQQFIKPLLFSHICPFKVKSRAIMLRRSVSKDNHVAPGGSGFGVGDGLVDL